MANHHSKVRSFLPLKTKSGFGLLEVLISAVIIMTLLGALVTVGRAAMDTSDHLTERAQAAYLAGEGIEIVRQIRDTNWIDGDNATGWDSLTPDKASALSRITTDGDIAGYLRLSGDRYYLIADGSANQDATTVDGLEFIRSVRISRPAGDLLARGITNRDSNALRVDIEVRWRSDSYRLSEILTNWRPNY
ncbi:MAG: hypothetical protein AAB360_01760 [Patescibacteria group bacterium]